VLISGASGSFSSLLSSLHELRLPTGENSENFFGMQQSIPGVSQLHGVIRFGRIGLDNGFGG
jgi:hypothetical protein